MDARERIEDLHTALLVALEGWQTGIWTALPCVVTKVNMPAMTCEAQPTIMVPVYNKASQAVNMEIPVLRDVPMVFPGGGGFSLTFPVQVGDECLVVFASRAIDAWWAYGGVLPQADTRMHDLSDGFAFVGVKSKPNVIPNISTSAVQLRNTQGTSLVSIGQNQELDIESAGSTISIGGVGIHYGDVTVVGASRVDVTAAGEITITSGVSLNLIAPGGTIKANGNTLG